MKVAVFNGYDGSYGCCSSRPMRYSNFGALSTGQQAAYKKFMDTQVEGLRRNLAELRTKRSSTGVYADTATFQTLIDRLDTSSRNDVMNEVELLDKWGAAAQTIAQGLLDQAKLMADSDTLVNKLARSAPDIQDGIASIKQTITDIKGEYGWIPWAVGGGLGLAVLTGIAWRIAR